MAYPFRDPKSGEQAYWRDVGTVDAFWEANQELIGVTPPLSLYDEQLAHLDLSGAAAAGQVRLRRRRAPRHGRGLHGLRRLRHLRRHGASLAAVLQRARQLLLHVQDSVVLPNVEIGRNCRIRRAVIDRWCKIPAGTVIGYDRAADEAAASMSPRAASRW
jgi:glucose-1-phosphate adenylyltransferase